MTNTEITLLFDQAMAAYDAGHFREALLQFERLCSLCRDDVRAWYMQGMASRGLGDRDHAAKCMEYVLRLDPEYINAHLCLAEMLQAQGRLTEAVGNFHRVLELDPENPAVRPPLAAAYGSMASDCRARSDWAGAEKRYRTALRYMPSMPALHLNLGLVLQAQGMHDAAIESLRAALGLDPHHVAGAMALSQLLLQHGEYAESLRYCLVALQQGANDMGALQHFIKVINVQQDVQSLQAARHWIERCLDAGGIDWQRLSRPVTVILNSDPEVAELITLLREGQVAALQDRLTGEQPPGVLHESLFNRALARFLFCDPDIELLLGGLRRTFLAVVSNVPVANVRAGIVDDDGRFLAALACQCFTSEYSYMLDDESAGCIQALETGLAADFAAGRWDAQRDIARVCVYAMYRPLQRLPGVEWLFADGCCLRGDVFKEFLEIQWYGPQRELEIRSRIPDITDIEDTVSHQVRAMYEASPYPPWLSVARHVPRPFGQVVRQMFPAVVAPKTEGDHVDLLVAGCGTGKQAIMSASRYINSRVLAVDLSLSSLAYAQRKADELGADNIRFARADILKLASLPDRFHVIESVGVLHHMAQPQQGLAVLTGLLHGNGLLQIGLYSARARRFITQLQTHFREAGFTSAPDDIRRARQEILVTDNEACRQVKRIADIYSISGCRDLLFHVQERVYTLADIASLLEQTGLRFLGFGWGNPRAPTRYRQLFPDDPAMTDLARWDAFEQRYPGTFLGMYVCWCQKI